MTFDVRTTFDERLLTIEAADLHRYLSTPTVFDLRKHGKLPLFISTLLHGNETSGWDAVRRFLDESPDASIVLMIGNVDAAARDMRHLPDEADFNRIWRSDPWRSKLDRLLREVQPRCGVDIHNNSGPNPHFSVVTDLKSRTLALAGLFSERVIYTNHTLDILAHAVAAHCPATTAEVGTVDDPHSVERAYKLIKYLSDNTELPSNPTRALEGFATIGIVKVEHENGSLETFPTFSDTLRSKSFKTVTAGSAFIQHLPKGWGRPGRRPSTGPRPN